MTRYGKDFELDQKLMDTIASYMNDGVREDLHDELAPCEPKLFLCAYLYRAPDFWKLLKSEFGISIEDEEIIGTLINASYEWQPELCEKLIKLADLKDKSSNIWEEYKKSDSESYEEIVEKAADILGVEIY